MMPVYVCVGCGSVKDGGGFMTGNYFGAANNVEMVGVAWGMSDKQEVGVSISAKARF